MKRERETIEGEIEEETLPGGPSFQRLTDSDGRTRCDVNPTDPDEDAKVDAQILEGIARCLSDLEDEASRAGLAPLASLIRQAREQARREIET